MMRRTRLSSASVQAELRRLTELGAVRREEDGGRVWFSTTEGHPAWYPWMLLLRNCAAPADLLREVLVDAAGLEGAFIFGSMARGDADERSDLDVFLIGSKEACEHAAYLLNDAAILVEKELDVLSFRRDEILSRLANGNRFIRRVMREPQVWLHGDPSILSTEAAA